MTVKSFLKSQTFRCILVLCVIAMIAGGLLAIMHDLLTVTPEEKTMRAIESIYGKALDYEEIALGENGENEYGKVESLYLLADGNYLFKSTGKEGYKNGTVTLWIVANFSDGKFQNLGKVAVESYEKQTLMSSYSDKYFDVYTDYDAIPEEKYFSTSGVEPVFLTGATKSGNAINNAVNCTLCYIRTVMKEEK